MPRGSQNRSQNGTKSMIFFDIEKVPLEDLLGAVLERSWSVFGVIWGGKNLEKPLVFLGFFENPLFGKKCVSRAVLDPTWGNLGAKRDPKDTPKGTQNEPKIRSKKERKKRTQKERKRGAPEA